MATSVKYALSSVRKTQFVIAGISLPFAIAAIADSEDGKAETVVQLVSLAISMFASLLFLFKGRKAGKQQYPVLDILGDMFFLVLFISVWIVGIVILAVKEVERWRPKYAQGIPHIYTNLACLLLWLSYAYAFFIAIYRRYLVQLFKGQCWRPWGTAYIQCPSCDRSASALEGPNTRWMDDTHERSANSFDHTPGLYTDDEAEAQTLLRGDYQSSTKQETGIIKLTEENV